MIRASMVCKHRVHDNDGRQEIDLLVASDLLHGSALERKKKNLTAVFVAAHLRIAETKPHSRPQLLKMF
jgi:hypothetical protein